MINYDKFLNRELSNVKPSGIRRFFDIASEIDDVYFPQHRRTGFHHAMAYS